MTYLRYFLSELIAAPAMLLSLLLADIIALFVKKDGRLIWPLRWAATADNPAIGDKAFNENQIPLANPNTWLGRYVLCRAWIRRNPAYWCDYMLGLTLIEGYKYTEEGDTEANIGRYSTGEVYGHAGSYTKHLINGDGKEYFEHCRVWFDGKLWQRRQYGWHLHTIRLDTLGSRRHLKLTINRW